MVGSTSNTQQVQVQQVQVQQVQDTAHTRTADGQFQSKSSTDSASQAATFQRSSPVDSYSTAAAIIRASSFQASTSPAKQVANNAPAKAAAGAQAVAKTQTDAAEDAIHKSQKTDTVQLSATAQAEAFHQLGFTISEIANRLGVSAAAVDGYLKITPATNTASLVAGAASGTSGTATQAYTAGSNA